MNVRALDKFYTKQTIVKKLIKKIDFNNFDLIVEPSAGNGAFLNEIDHKQIIALDIFPENKNIIKQDWFDFTIPQNYKKVLIIGNPPFGINNELSSRFLKHGFSFDNVSSIAFILPNVYKKHTNQKIIPKEYKITDIIDIGRNAFTLDGNPYHVPCAFFIFASIKTRDKQFAL